MSIIESSGISFETNDSTYLLHRSRLGSSDKVHWGLTPD